MLLLSKEKSTQSRTAITPFSAFLMGDRLPYVWGGYNDLVFFVSALSGQLTSQGIASPGAFSAFKSTPEASLGAFSGFGSAPEASPAYFQPSKVLPKPRLARFWVSGELPRLPRRIFNLQKCSRGFPGVFSTLKSAPEASLGVFSTFGRTPEAFVAVLRTAYRVFFENSRAIFVARRCLATKALSIRFKQKSS